jgi:hypothetical protein
MSCNRLSRLVRSSGRCSGIGSNSSHLAYTAGLLKEVWQREAEVMAGNLEDRRQGVVDPYSLPALDPRPHIAPGRLLDGLKKACVGCGAAPQRLGLWYTIGGIAYCEDCAPQAARQISAGLLIPHQEPVDGANQREKQRLAEQAYGRKAAFLGVTPISTGKLSNSNTPATASLPVGKSVSSIDAPLVPRITTPQALDPDGGATDRSAIFTDRIKAPGHFVSGPAASPTYSYTDGRPMAVYRPMTLKKCSGAKVFESGGELKRGQLDELYLLEDERGNPSGWAITPVMKAANGMVTPTNRWTVTHMQSGSDVTTLSFESPEAAFELGERLAQINVDLTDDGEFRRIAATIRATLQAYQNEQLRREIPDPQGGLTHQIGLDSQDEAVRVLEDFGEVLVVTNRAGQTRNMPRLTFRATAVLEDDDEITQSHESDGSHDENQLDDEA